MTSALAVSGLRKAYGPTRVLDGLDLRIAPGEAFALAGANGAGKTTLIKILLDLVRPDGGEAALFGIPSDRVEARAAVAYLPERFAAPRHLTGRQFLRTLLGLQQRAYDEAAAASLLRRLDLDPAALDRKVATYSKGMGQKLGLAGALLAERPLLVLDEPMSGLDPKARYLLKQALKSRAGGGRALFYSTHLLADAEDLCDRIGILHEGALRFVGTPDECRRRYGAADLEEAYMRCIGALDRAEAEAA